MPLLERFPPKPLRNCPPVVMMLLVALRSWPVRVIVPLRLRKRPKMEVEEELEVTVPAASLVSELKVLVLWAVSGLFVSWINGALAVLVRLLPLKISMKSPVLMALFVALRSGPESVIVVGTRVAGEVEKSKLPQQILRKLPFVEVEVEVDVVPALSVEVKVEVLVLSIVRGLPIVPAT